MAENNLSSVLDIKGRFLALHIGAIKKYDILACEASRDVAEKALRRKNIQQHILWFT